MTRAYDTRNGRPLTDGSDRIDTLSDSELEAELTIAAGEPRHRARRLAELLSERGRRSGTRSRTAKARARSRELRSDAQALKAQALLQLKRAKRVR
jgi:hypothetical protein